MGGGTARDGNRCAGTAAALVCGMVMSLMALALFGVTPPANADTAPAVVPDPAQAGPFAVTKIEYDAGATLVDDPSTHVTYPEELMGSLHIPTAPGLLPVIVLLHGRHATCAVVGVQASASPCPDTPATADIRSYEGYDYLARNLASHGYLVMSVNANGVNSYDAASRDSGGNQRAEVLARSLDLLAKWNQQAGPGDVGTRLVGKVDLARIGMMGHSRGGGGVTDFVAYNRTRSDGPRYPGLRAIFDLAGTDYNTPVVTDINYGDLAPLCDGDVYDLQSLFTWDRSRFADPNEPGARVMFAVNGADHNYFNTIWTADDYSGTDTACDPASPTSNRLTPADQRRVGLVLIAAFLRRYVGPEPAFDGLMTGAAPLPASICPGGAGPCDGLVRTSYIGPVAARRMLVGPNTGSDALTTTTDGGKLTASGFSAYSYCDPHADSGHDGGNRDPGTNSGCPTNPDRSRARQLTLAWDGPATLRAALGRGGSNVARFRALTFRTAVNFSDPRNAPGAPQDFYVALVDRRGRSTAVRAASFGAALEPPPGSGDRKLVPEEIRIPLSAFRGTNLQRVKAVELRFGNLTARGCVQLLELMFQEGDPPGPR
jgi:dienelactone hydrolase